MTASNAGISGFLNKAIALAEVLGVSPLKLE
jgi:hypothetical protein